MLCQKILQRNRKGIQLIYKTVHFILQLQHPVFRIPFINKLKVSETFYTTILQNSPSYQSGPDQSPIKSRSHIFIKISGR